MPLSKTPLNKTKDEMTNSKVLMKKRDEVIVRARKFLKKGDTHKALNNYYTALQIQVSDKINKEILALEEKIIQKSFPKEYEIVHNKSYNNGNGDPSNIFLNLENHFKLWPVQKKITYFLETKQWDKVDAMWSKDIVPFLDAVFVGKYYIEKKNVWDTFLLWQPLLAPLGFYKSERKTKISNKEKHVLPEEKSKIEKPKNIEKKKKSKKNKTGDISPPLLKETHIDMLKQHLITFISKREIPHLDGLTLDGAFWLSIHMPQECFKTMIHYYINQLIYEGLWHKGFKFYNDITEICQTTSWMDTNSQILDMNLKCWKVHHGQYKTPQECSIEVKNILKQVQNLNLVKELHTEDRESFLNLLSEFLQAPTLSYNNDHWTTLCYENPYKMMDMRQPCDQKSMMNLFARSIAQKKMPLNKLLKIQRILANPQTNRVLKLMFSPINKT